MAKTADKEKKKGKKKDKEKGDNNGTDYSQLPLPEGWEKKYSREKDKAYYIDHNTRETYWKHPSDPKFKRKKQKDNDIADAGATSEKGTADAGSGNQGGGPGGASGKENKADSQQEMKMVNSDPKIMNVEADARTSAPAINSSTSPGIEEIKEVTSAEVSEMDIETVKNGITPEVAKSMKEKEAAIAAEEARQKQEDELRLQREAEERERERVEAEAEAEAVLEAEELAKRAEDERVSKAMKLEQAESLAKEISEKVEGVPGDADKGKEEKEEKEEEEEPLAEDEIDIFSEEESVVEPYEEAPLPCPYNPTAVPAKQRREALRNHRAKHGLSSVTSNTKRKDGANSMSVSRHMIMDLVSPLITKHTEPLSYTDVTIIEDLMTDGDKPVLPPDSFASQTIHDDEQAVRRMQMNTNTMLGCANNLKPKALEKVEKTNIYGASKELQVLSNDIKPYMYPEDARKTCLKCSNSFNSLTRLKHHCYSCGEMFCNSCANNFWPMDIRESVGSDTTDKAYKKPVRVCDYCVNHLSAGDLNSVLRYLGVVRVKETKPAARESALHAMLKSVEWEIQIPLEEKGSGKNVNIVDSAYKGLYTSAAQIGGWEIFWRCLLHNLGASNSGEIRDYTCKIVISVFNRLDSIDNARFFFLQDGMRLLGNCLSDPICKVSSALAMYTALSAFPVGSLQFSGFGGAEGVSVLTIIVENLRDPDIVPAFRTLLLTTVGLIIGAPESSGNEDALDGLVAARYHVAMMEYTRGDEEHHQIALEGLGRLLRRLGSSPAHPKVILDLLDGGIIDSVVGYLGPRWATLLEEKSYNQVLSTEQYHSLAFIEILSEAFDSHSHLLKQRNGMPLTPSVDLTDEAREATQEGGKTVSVFSRVMDILGFLMNDPTEYRTGNEGWQILVSTTLSVALNLMSFGDFDSYVPYESNLKLVGICLDILMMPHVTDLFLVHQAVAALSHYGYDLEFAETLTLTPNSARHITEACVKIISTSMATLRENTRAINSNGDDRQPSALRRLSTSSKLLKTTHRYNPSDIMAFHLLSGILYTTYTAKVLQAEASVLLDEEKASHSGYADDFFDLYDDILSDDAVGQAVKHYLQYINSTLDSAQKREEAGEGTPSPETGAQASQDENGAAQPFVEGVPVLQFVHTLASCRGRIHTVDRYLRGVSDDGTVALLVKLLNGSYEVKDYAVLENVMWALGSLGGAPGFFAWEEDTLESIYGRLTAASSSGPYVAPSEASSVSSSTGVDILVDSEPASYFSRNVGTDEYKVSAYEKALLTFARQRASMNVEASYLYLREEECLANRDEMKEICASIEEMHTVVRAMVPKHGHIFTPGLACHFGTPVMVAALRVMQGVLRDGDEAIAEGGRGVSIKALLRFTGHVACDTIPAIIALDVVDVLTAHPDVWSSAGLARYSESLSSACNDICVFLDEQIDIVDPVVLVKGMEALAELSSLKVCHDSICAHLLPLVQQIANLYPGNVLLEDENVNTDSLFRSMLRVVAKLGKNESVASWLQSVLPILLKVLPTAEAILSSDVTIPELEAACMRPSGTDVFYSSRVVVATLTAIGDCVETYEPNLRFALAHPSVTTTGQGLIGHVFDQLELSIPEEDRAQLLSSKEALLRRGSLDPAPEWQPTDFGEELSQCLRILYLVAGAHFDPMSVTRVCDRKVDPVDLAAGSLPLAFNLFKEGEESAESVRSYLVFRMLLRMWSQGDEGTSLQALTVLARAGCGYEYSTHAQRLNKDLSQLHRHKDVLLQAPWQQLLADRQVYLIYDLLESAGRMTAGFALCVGDKRDPKELITRISMALRKEPTLMASLPKRIVQYEGREETLYLRVCLEENVGPPDGIPADGDGTTLGAGAKVPGSLDPSSAYMVQLTACIALRTIVHELRFIPHEKAAMMDGEEGEDEGDGSTRGSMTDSPAVAVASEVRDQHFPAMRAAIISLCRTRKLMDVVQDVSPVIIQACYLFQDITQWADVLLSYSGLHAVTTMYEAMLSSIADSAGGASGMASKSHFTMLSVLCLWVSRSHHHPKLRHLLLMQLDRSTVCSNLATVLNFHVRALQEGGHDEPAEPSAPALCVFVSMATSLQIVHQVLEIFRLFFDHEKGDDAEEVVAEKAEEEDKHSVRARTGQAIVRALTVVLAVEQQRLAGDSDYRYESMPHLSPRDGTAATEPVDESGAGDSALVGNVQGQEEEQEQEQEQEQEPLELVDIYPGSPGYPELPVKARESSRPAFTVSAAAAAAATASPAGVARSATEDRAKSETLSPWIKSPLGVLEGRQDKGLSEEGLGEDESEQGGEEEDDIWAVDEDHHEDLIEVDLSDSMCRFWDLTVALTESPTFIEALLPSVDCGSDTRFGGKAAPLRLLEMTVVMELLRIGTGIARDPRRHGQDNHLLLIEYCVKVLRNVFNHRPMELIRLLLASGQDLRHSATGDEFGEEEGCYNVDNTEDAEEYCAVLTRYISHVYSSLQDSPGGDGKRYVATAFELANILSTLAANSIPLCAAILSSTACGGNNNGPTSSFEKGAFLVCCADRIVEGCALAATARDEKQKQIAARRIFALWKASKEARAAREKEEAEEDKHDAASIDYAEAEADPHKPLEREDSLALGEMPAELSPSAEGGLAAGSPEERKTDSDLEDMTREHEEEGEDEVGHLDVWISLLANLCRTKHGRVDVLYYCSPICAAFLPLLLPSRSAADARGEGSIDMNIRGSGAHLPAFYLRISRLRVPNCPLHRTKAAFIQLLASLGPALHGAEGSIQPVPVTVAASSNGPRLPKPRHDEVSFCLHSGETLFPDICSERLQPHCTTILQAALACLCAEQRDLRLVTMALSVVTQLCGLPGTQDIMQRQDTLQGICDLLPRVVAMAPGARAIVCAAGALAGSRANLAPLGGSHATLALQATHLCVRLLNSLLMKRGTPAAVLPTPLVKLLLLLSLSSSARESSRDKQSLRAKSSATPAQAPDTPAKGGSPTAPSHRAILEVVWAPVITHVVEIVHLLGLDLYNRETLATLCKDSSEAAAVPTPLGLSMPLLRPLPLATSKKNITSALLMVQVQGLNAYLQPCERPAAVPALYQASFC